jgi:hypothetical protein
VRQLTINKGLRNDTDYFAAAGESCVGNDTHEADIASAVDKAEASASKCGPDLFGSARKGRVSTWAGAAKYANAFHRIAER